MVELVREQAGSPPMSEDAERPEPGVVWDGPSIPSQPGPPESEERRDAVVWSAHRPRVSAVRRRTSRSSTLLGSAA